jgi:hypothetical protein
MLILFCILSISKGQDSAPDKPEFILGVYTGYSRHIIRDEVASPLIYRGGSSPVLLEFEYQKSLSRHALSFFIGNTKLYSSNTNKSGSISNYADNLNILLAYSYSRNTGIFQRFNVNCFWGFTFLSVINYRSLYFNNNSSIPFFEQINSLGVNLFIEKKIGPKKSGNASFKINLPFVAYITFNDRYNSVVGRSLDNFDVNNSVFGQVISNGEFVTFNKLFEFQTKFSYTRFLTKHIGLSLEHQLHFYSISHYQDLLYARYLNNQYLIGLIIKL